MKSREHRPPKKWFIPPGSTLHCEVAFRKSGPRTPGFKAKDPWAPGLIRFLLGFSQVQFAGSQKGKNAGPYRIIPCVCSLKQVIPKPPRFANTQRKKKAIGVSSQIHACLQASFQSHVLFSPGLRYPKASKHQPNEYAQPSSRKGWGNPTSGV